MLAKLLLSHNIKLKVEAVSWQDAIQKGGELLVTSGIAEEQYIDAMVNAVNQFGPYFVLVPGVAMPHANSDSGTIKTGFSLITLKEPLDFMDSANNPVSIIICFAAINQDFHLAALQSLAQLLSNQEDLRMIREAYDIKEVLEIIKKYDLKEESE